MFFVLAIPAGDARAQTNTTNISDLLVTLQGLMKQVEELKARLAEITGDISDVRAEIKAGLREGMTDEDIKKLQELLATDPDIYPRGLVTGYFGPLTVDAIKRFQERHGLTVTGVIDEETRALINEYFKEKKDGRVPPGLLKAVDARERVKEKMQAMWGKCSDRGPVWARDCDDEDEDDDDLIDDQNRRSEKAEDAIEDAEDTIADLEDLIDEATTTVDTEDAEEALDDANEKLEDAQAAFAADNFERATELAKKARQTAKDAYDELEEAIEEAEDDDENDE